jgi:uroporphyrinogen decarboxylase
MKAARVRAALAGEVADRPPFSLWYHFRHEPETGEGFVRATLDAYRAYDVDLLKVMHDVPYELPIEKPVFTEPADWTMLPVNPPDAGGFGEQLRSLRQIREYKNDDAPVIDTIASVFAHGQRITQGRLLEQLDAEPDVVMAGLKRLAAALAGYAMATLENGGDGIFLAVAGADAGTLAAERYVEQFLPLDQLVLGSVAAGWCNVVHLHGDDLHFDALRPLTERAHAVSWSDRAAGPSLSEARARSVRCVVGGVDERRIAGYTPEQVRDEIADAVAQTGGGRGLIVAPGCSVPTETPPANLRAFKEAVEAARHTGS